MIMTKKWWLDKGLAGFRIDAIMNIKKGKNDYEKDMVERSSNLSDLSPQLYGQ